MQDIQWDYSRAEVVVYYKAAVQKEMNDVQNLAVANRVGANADKNEFKKFLDSLNLDTDKKPEVSQSFIEKLKAIKEATSKGKVGDYKGRVPRKAPPPPPRD